ncbi:NAD(P)-binding protein [Exidia glandulosa HHB12029]|uniref:NAD(P)-binding protein n=1 Tax=Exidia glandulosa HHB12029 TaxID=1314781 RepID=A0A165I519_EXIGL|nr:NAD(P)-binding protein [Exidia glandulosa HHB12029]
MPRAECYISISQPGNCFVLTLSLIMSVSRNFGPTTYNDEVIDTFPDRVRGRVFLVTGPAPNGLGDATLRALARGHPAALLLVGRTPASYAPVVDAIHSLDASILVRVYTIDLNSFASVRAGAAKILEENDEKGVDVVINSAGVMRADLKYTVDGNEEHFQANHLGHFLLTNLLMPLLRKSEEPRVVNVSSGAYVVGTGDYSDVNFKNRAFSRPAGYSQAKLANVHFSQALAKRGITSFALHPGVVRGTSLQRDMPVEQIEEMFAGAKARGYIFKELSQGASTTLVAARDPNIKDKSGGVLEDCRLVELHGEGAKKEGAAEELWKLSEKLVGQEFVF